MPYNLAELTSRGTYEVIHNNMTIDDARVTIQGASGGEITATELDGVIQEIALKEIEFTAMAARGTNVAVPEALIRESLQNLRVAYNGAEHGLHLGKIDQIMGVALGSIASAHQIDALQAKAFMMKVALNADDVAVRRLLSEETADTMSVGEQDTAIAVISSRWQTLVDDLHQHYRQNGNLGTSRATLLAKRFTFGNTEFALSPERVTELMHGIGQGLSAAEFNRLKDFAQIQHHSLGLSGAALQRKVREESGEGISEAQMLELNHFIHTQEKIINNRLITAFVHLDIDLPADTEPDIARALIGDAGTIHGENISDASITEALVRSHILKQNKRDLSPQEAACGLLFNLNLKTPAASSVGYQVAMNRLTIPSIAQYNGAGNIESFANAVITLDKDTVWDKLPAAMKAAIGPIADHETDVKIIIHTGSAEFRSKTQVNMFYHPWMFPDLAAGQTRNLPLAMGIFDGTAVSEDPDHGHAMGFNALREQRVHPHPVGHGEMALSGNSFRFRLDRTKAFSSFWSAAKGTDDHGHKRCALTYHIVANSEATTEGLTMALEASTNLLTLKGNLTGIVPGSAPITEALERYTA